MDNVEGLAVVIDRVALWVEQLARVGRQIGAAVATLSLLFGISAAVLWASTSVAVAGVVFVVSVVGAGCWLAAPRRTSRMSRALANLAMRLRLVGAQAPFAREGVRDAVRQLAGQIGVGGIRGLLRLRHVRKLKSLAVAIGFDDTTTITTTSVRVAGLVLTAIAASTVVAVGVALGVLLTLV